MLTFVYTEEEWKALTPEGRENMLALSEERKALERAITNIGREMRNRPELRRDWDTLKKYINRDNGAKVFIQRPNGIVDLI